MRSILALGLVLMGCPSPSGECEDLACVEAKLRPATCPDGGCLNPNCPAQPSPADCPGGGTSWLRDNATGACCEYACAAVFAPTGFTAFNTESQCESRVECNGYAVGAVLPSGDGCNNCTCENGTSGGRWSCTENNCSDAGVSKSCGFFQGGCAATEYCSFVPDDLCSAGDATGLCIERPASCGIDDAPACGCDNKQYTNRCEAARAGAGIIDLGTCRKHAQCTSTADCEADEYCPLWAGNQFCVKRPLACVNQLSVVCGTDGLQYGNACLAAQAGANVRKAGVCAAHCAGNEDCASNEYCTACAGGTCVTKTPNQNTCQVSDPVCGCDGQTYACTALTQGQVGVAHAGACH